MEPEQEEPQDTGVPSAAAPPSLTTLDFAAVFVQSQIGMALVAPDGRMLLVTEALGRLLGRSTEALLTTRLADLIPADQQTLAATLLAEPGGDQPRQVEIRN